VQCKATVHNISTKVMFYGMGLGQEEMSDRYVLSKELNDIGTP
jgi:hypothetical protein